MNTCPQCNYGMRPDWKKCPECGTKLEGSGASPCPPSIYEVLRNNIAAMDPETETGAWGIEVLEGILAICPEENSKDQSPEE